MRPTGRIHIACWLVLALFGLFANNGTFAQTFLIHDDQFLDPDWVHALRPDSGPGSQTVVRQATIANPTGYQEGTHAWSAGTLRTAHILAAQVYSPYAQGPINSIDMSFDLQMTVGSGTNKETHAGLLLRQAGQTYAHAVLEKFTLGSDWKSAQFSALIAGHFGLVGAAGVDWSIHPDFSCAGDAIELGYTVVNTSSKPNNSVIWNVDNFQATIHQASGEDCNSNGIADACDVAQGLVPDCNDNGVPDSCDIASAASHDCNANAILDECDVASGNATDSNGDNIPDVCQFPEIGANLTGVSYGKGAWGDYDGDGDLDLAITGSRGGNPSSIMYRNDESGVFTESAYPIRVKYSAQAWGDYDRDGDLDLVVSGLHYNGLKWLAATRLHRNDSGVFADVNASIRGLQWSAVAWGDYDNDGDLDLAAAGDNYGNPAVYYSCLYRNEGGSFVEIDAGLAPVTYASLAWGDYDNDADLDLALAGHSSLSGAVTIIYQNNDGVFSDIAANLLGAAHGSLAWGDYDADGDLDLVVMGSYGLLNVLRVYRNDGGIFVDLNAGLAGLNWGSAIWGDYDNDGDLDLAAAGETGPLTTLYRNDGADGFTPFRPTFAAGFGPSLAWGDYDGDHDLDLFYCGGNLSRIYRNDAAPANTRPIAPSGLTANAAGDRITFAWSAGDDEQTPAAGLSYNLRVGTSPGSNDVVSGMADSASGRRHVPGLGNAQQRLNWTIRNLPPRVYFWSVQAIDSAFVGSPWASEVWIATAFSRPDFDHDGDVDQADFQFFQACATGPAAPAAPGCHPADFDADSDVDQSDFAVFQRCYSSENRPANPNCGH